MIYRLYNIAYICFDEVEILCLWKMKGSQNFHLSPPRAHKDVVRGLLGQNSLWEQNMIIRVLPHVG